MKTETSFFPSILAILFSMLSLGSSATIHIVDNSPNAPNGVFHNVQFAHDTANAGDTLYVKGSPNNYGGLTLTKNLTVIGEGYNPQSGKPSHETELNQITLSGIQFISSSSGSRFYSLKASSIHINDYDNIIITRCDINLIQGNGYTSGTKPTSQNVIITHNILGNVKMDYNTIQNWIIASNLFNYGSNHNIITDLTLQNTGTISNNIIINSGYQFHAIYGGGLNVSNNTFIYNYSGPTLPVPITDFGNIIWNNVFCNYGNSTLTNPVSGSNSGGNNTFGCPTFKGGTQPLSTNWDVFDTDFELDPSSIGYLGGTDSTDVGIHGGGNPWPVAYDFASGKKYKLREPLPYFEEVNLLNGPTLPQGGNINIQVKARKSY